MPSTHVPVLEVEDEDIREVTPATAVLWRRLGIEALPEHETMLLPTERLVVPDADHLVRSAKRLVKSIQHVGILQNPSVVMKGGLDMHDDEATFESFSKNNAIVFKRGTPDEVHIEDVKQVNGQWLIAGTSGVVLAVVGTGQTMKQAQAQVYTRIKNILIPNMYYRTDIGDRWAEDSDKLHNWGYLR